MAKDNIIQFPSKMPTFEQKTTKLQNRLDEIEKENVFMRADIDYLTKAIGKNLDEATDILKEFAILNGEQVADMAVEFENEWGDDFEFTPDFEIKDNPEED